MKYIPEMPSCGHMGADFPRVYTTRGQAMKTANCPLCHQELTAQTAVIERITDLKYAALLAVIRKRSFSSVSRNGFGLLAKLEPEVLAVVLRCRVFL